jgi:selenide,water dikinase
VDQPEIFAAGDVASLLPEALPKSGVVAVRQGPVLARNLRAAAEGRPLEAYVPQRHWLVLVSLGDRRALGTRNGLVFGGRWVWWWKDRLDRSFMARYQAG